MRQLHTVPNLLFVSKNTTLRKYPNVSIICHFSKISSNFGEKYQTKLLQKQDFVNNEFVDTN